MAEFKEIAHAGGKITFDFFTDADGRRVNQISVECSRPVPVVMIAIYALPQGIPVASLSLGGIGDTWDPAPYPGCLTVLIQSDSEGKFGHHCPSCKGYWRSGPWPSVCPYCAVLEEGYRFLSEAQLRFVQHYCDVFVNADQGVDGKVVIDMDAVAVAAGKDCPKPSFYVSEESQQCKFNCRACDEFNDILGRFGFCSRCGTRNDLADFESVIAPAIRSRLNSGGTPSDAVRDAVAAFDSFIAQYAKQLAALVALTEPRKRRLTKQRFHNLVEIRRILKEWFDIDLCAGMDEARCGEVARLFYRRHVYEHNGGEVDQKYLDDSGDTTVKLKQAIAESAEVAHALMGSLIKMAVNLHEGFHTLIPPRPEPIKEYTAKRKRMGRSQGTQD